jgi:hypothetical protein
MNRRFGGTYRLHHQGHKIGELGILPVNSNGSTLIRNTQLADSYHPDDGGYTFLRKILSYKSHMA